jgi:hypothetical protein
MMLFADAFALRLAAGLVFLAVAAVLVWLLRQAMQRAADSAHWPSADGSVIAASMQVVAGAEQSRFRPLVEYAYCVGGRDYRGSRIQWGNLIDLPSRSAAAKVVGHYRTGTTVKVYYDPRQPRVAVLQPGHAAQTGKRVMIAPALALVGLFYLGWAFFS